MPIDPVTGALIAGIGGDLLGGLFGSSAQKKANKANIQLQRENQAWMERLSNTSYQRGTADMKAAGLNPMLAYSQGGANTPSSSAATVEPVDAMARAANSAGSKAAQALQLRNMDVNNRILEEKAKQEAMTTKERAATMPTNLDPDVIAASKDKAYSESDEARSNARIKDIERQLAEDTFGYNVNSARARSEILNQEVTLNQIRQMLMRLDIPEKQAMAKWFETVGAGSPAAKAIMTVSQWLKFILRR